MRPVFSTDPKGADVKGADTKGADTKAAGPVAQGAGGVPTKPGEAPRESNEKHVAALLAKLATPKARQAEIALDILQDARLSYAQIAGSHPPPTEDQIYGARLHLDTAQAAAQKVAADNLAEQLVLRDEKTAAWHAARADQEAYIKRNPRGPHAEELKAKAYWADVDRHFSEEKVAVAESLRDIANGTRPGRAELSQDTRLNDAKAAEAKLTAVRREIFAGGLDGGERHDLIDQYRNAASANRAEWAAAHHNAIASGAAALIEQTRRGLEQAEQRLLDVRFVD
jgi:hypothetical protein